ncbi:adhesive plaque matrix protein 2-like isoform X2 [Actinia tenebrosa]|uniref:Adhesive plaque matrix protein 2-like isoform X2 n=1 Tax=Actinia tenebrosa TaxID=6105 RepID=A0A6P8H727_ACTTE|nr:adhesive plaque matrix protein 2-like isoform X2 [Actinia tenebrosa]
MKICWQIVWTFQIITLATAQVFQYFLVDQKGENAKILDTIKLPTCTHLDIRKDVTLRQGINAGKFTKLGVMRDMQTCVDACCHDPSCDVAFMPGNVCYTVKCHSDKSCESIPAIPSMAANGSVQISHIVRGGGEGDDIENFKKTQGIGKYVTKKPHHCVPSRIAYNFTLRGGKTAGKVQEIGVVDNVYDCIDRCCQSESCDVAFFLKQKCYTVECYSDELCQSVPVKKSKSFNPTIVYMNKRNNKRQKHKDFCAKPCVNGLCAGENNCLCDRGFEGEDCNKTARIGFCGFSGCGVYGRCLHNDTCQCALGHFGDTCSKRLTCNPPCHNGVCVDNSTESRECKCYIGWEGKHCNISNGATIVNAKDGEEVLFTKMSEQTDLQIHDLTGSDSAESISSLAVAIGCGVAAAIVGTAAVALVARRVLEHPDGWKGIN